jgi:5'-nucleotidase (lipoprotein e(P4) family)
VTRAPAAAMLLSAAALGGCATTAVPSAAPIAASPTTPGAGFQYLYGSGEAGALSIQAFRALLDHVAVQVKTRPTDSVVLAEGATLDAPIFVPCGNKPLAAVFDVDETLVLNLGFEEKDARRGGGPFDSKMWDRWEKTGAGSVSPVPGAVFAVNALRAQGVAVIFNTNRAAANVAGTVAAIKAAGLGDAVHGETLFLSGDDATGSRKDGRRWRIAARHCVIALGGDQLGDFSDLFNQIKSVPDRRMASIRGRIAQLWGAGWFALPNPVYGSGLKGGFDDIFPADKRWADPAEEEK